MNKGLNYFTEGVILAAIPAGGYWTAYLYELGYCNFFEIPPELIDISINSILLNSLAVLGIAILMVFAVDFIGKLMVGVSSAVKGSLYKLIFIYFIGYGFYFSFGRSQTELKIFLTIFALPMIIKDFVWPLWSQRHIKGFGNKVAAAKKRDFEYDSATDKIANKIGIEAFLVCGALYVISILSYLAGGYGASSETEFLSAKAKPNYILARKYGESWVAVRFDETKKIFYPDFQILKLEDVNQFTRRVYGRLTPQED